MYLFKVIAKAIRSQREYNRALKEVASLFLRDEIPLISVNLSTKQLDLLYELACRGITNVDEFESYEKAKNITQT